MNVNVQLVTRVLLGVTATVACIVVKYKELRHHLQILPSSFIFKVGLGSVQVGTSGLGHYQGSAGGCAHPGPNTQVDFRRHRVCNSLDAFRLSAERNN